MYPILMYQLVPKVMYSMCLKLCAGNDVLPCAFCQVRYTCTTTVLFGDTRLGLSTQYSRVLLSPFL